MRRTKAVKLLALVVIAGGVLVMLGWFFDIMALKRILPSWSDMRLLTALSFVLAGISLFAMVEAQRGSDGAKIAVMASSLAILLIAGASLISALLGVYIGLERPFIHEAPGTVWTQVPGRLSGGTMVGFILVGIIGLITIASAGSRILVRYAGHVTMALAASAVLGYILHAPKLYYEFPGASVAMAFHTAVLFGLLGLGLAVFPEGDA